MEFILVANCCKQYYNRILFVITKNLFSGDNANNGTCIGTWAINNISIELGKQNEISVSLFHAQSILPLDYHIKKQILLKMHSIFHRFSGYEL